MTEKLLIFKLNQTLFFDNIGAPSQITARPPTTAPAVCQYKGQSYSQGQSWQDGCLYNCSCEDAAIGFYRCKNL